MRRAVGSKALGIFLPCVDLITYDPLLAPWGRALLMIAPCCNERLAGRTRGRRSVGQKLLAFCLHCTFHTLQWRFSHRSLVISIRRRHGRCRRGCARRVSWRAPEKMRLSTLVPGMLQRRPSVFARRPWDVSPGGHWRISKAVRMRSSLLPSEVMTSTCGRREPRMARTRPLAATAEVSKIWRVLWSSRTLQAVFRLRALRVRCSAWLRGWRPYGHAHP